MRGRFTFCNLLVTEKRIKNAKNQSEYRTVVAKIKHKWVFSKEIGYMRKPKIATLDKRITEAINIHNIQNIYAFSLVVCIMELISLTLYFITNKNSTEFIRTMFSVGFCIITCAIVAVLSYMIKQKYKREGVISNIKVNALTLFFYSVMSVWGIIVDSAHYGDGDQMLTFYIVQFCFVCFVVLSPKFGSILIALAFSAMYVTLFYQHGATHIQPQNYFIFAVIAVFGNAMQHLLLQKSEKSKLEIRELNQILEQEASIDDLTQLKNRKALHDDYEKFMGKTLSVLMADIDYFKSVNDTYGHVIGDTVLRMVAKVTKETFIDGESYRYGGDEFLVIVPECTEEAFEIMIKQWHETIKTIQIPNTLHPISCSSGSERC